jgi:hypothetical protein
MALNIAEGRGDATNGDRRRYFEIARGSTLKGAAIQDTLQTCEALSADDNNQQKALLDLTVAMLMKRGQRGDVVREEVGEGKSVSSIPISKPTPVSWLTAHKPIICLT